MERLKLNWVEFTNWQIDMNETNNITERTENYTTMTTTWQLINHENNEWKTHIRTARIITLCWPGEQQPAEGGSYVRKEEITRIIN